ncbi:DnaJ-like protein [Alteromonas sp. 76-1]|uniref:J domain-containing protein n=1 Tax=Alteromonas sp. 76-1 TaxID=2358187 RepID=UPI000FD15F90|nr:J domain-containing protein [Alteromonas sp. 76-1]VEL95957.1 DnaJ-like protein [Alteromonas sp. 76-1]
MIKVIAENGRNPSTSSLFKNNDIIKKYNGVVVYSRGDLLRLIELSDSGVSKKVEVIVIRHGTEKNITVNKGLLGLILTESLENDSGFVKKTLLDEANTTIRKANIRIEKLKKELNQALSKEPSFNDLSAYDLMGIYPNCEIDVLKQNYKKLSLIYHPDRSKSHVMMKIINKAYEETYTEFAV